MKNFTKQITNKTLFKPTRWLLMALMLLVGTSSAWGWTVIYDNTDTQWDEVYLYVGKGDWSECNLKMTEYDTNLFVFKGSGWNDATEVAFANKPLGGSSTENICTKLKNDNTVKPKVTYCHQKDFNKTYKYKATGLTSNDANCSDESRYYWPSTNDRVETTFNGTVIQLAGSFNDWGSSTDYCVSTNNSTCSFEKELAANNKYEFKIIIDGTWYSSEGSISVGGDKVTFYTDKGNSYFKAASDGIYTFNIDKDKNVWITYHTACTPPADFTISIDKTAICSGGNATITIPNDHSAESYKWCTKNGDTYGNETTIDNKSFTVSAAGTYVVRAYNSTCMTESNPVTLTVDEKPTITVTPPSTICSGSEIDLSDYVKTDKGTLTYNDNSQSVFTPNDNTTYNIVATNGACSATSTITVTVANETKPQQLTTAGNGYNMENCTDITITVNDNTNTILAVLYKGYNIEPTSVVDGTEYKIGDKIGEGNVVHKDNAAAIVIKNLDPEQDHTCVIYQYTDVCKLYSEPLILSLKKNVPEFEPITITPNGTSVTLRTEATHIGTNIAGVVIDIANFYYKKTNDAEWTPITATKSGEYNKVCTATITNLIQGATYQFKFEASNNSCKDNKVTVEGTEDVTIECPTVTPPTLTGAAYCGSQNSVTLPTVSGYWYDSQTDGNKVTSPVNVANTTTYYATSKDGECESVRVPYIITINPVPTITVDAGNETPFLNQEVELTATGNDIASVEWDVNKGSITPNPDDSKYAILTHSGAEIVTVTATATSAAGCKSTAETKTVEFSAKDCEPTITRHPKETKIRAKMKEGQTSWNVFKIYSYGVTDSDSNGWPGAEMELGTGEDEGYYVYTFENVTADFNIILNNGNSGGANQTVSGAAKAGKIYTFEVGAKSCSQDNDTRRCLESSNVDYTTTTYPELSAPAVNTVSVTSQVGSGVVNFTGQVVKTGCAANNQIWVGYQYKLATEEWPTTGVTAADQAGANPLVLNPLGNPNGLDPFTANITLTDGTYDFRAYVINGYDRGNSSSSNYDQGVYYGLTKRVTVSLQQQAITSVTIEHAAIDGKTITDPTYCAGTTAYIKLTHDNTPYKGEVVWTSTANHDFSKVEGKENLFSYTVKGEDNVTASVKNDENANYVSSDPLNIKVYPVPNMPNFTIDKTAICSTDDVGAVITVTNPQVGITYQVYKKVGDNETAHGDAVTYNNGDLTINSIKTAGTYFVKAWNEQCKDKVERSLTEAEVTIVDANANSIAITPTSKEVNPWMPTTFIVNKTGSYNYTLTCTQTNAQVGSATVSSGNVNIEYDYSFVPTNNGVQVTFTWTNMNNITGAVAPYLHDRTDGFEETQRTGNSVTKEITPNAQGNVIVAAKFAYADGGSATTSDYTFTNQGDAPANDAIITKKGDTYIIKFPKPADAQIVNGQVTFNPIQYNVTAKLNVDVQGCGTTVATSNVTLTPLTEVCP